MDSNLVDSKSIDSQSPHYLALQFNDFLAQFIESAREVIEQMEHQQQQLEQKLHHTEMYIEERLQNIVQELESYKETLLNTHSAQYRNQLKQILEASDMHIELMKSVHTDIQQSVQASCQQLKHVSEQASTDFASTLANIRTDELKQYAESSCRRIEKTSSYIVRRMSALINWFHWKNVFLSLGVTMVAMLMLALYINDEAPWESHRLVKQERLAGAALMKIWPQLSEADRQLIATAVKAK